MSARDESNLLPADLKDYGESEGFMIWQEMAGAGLWVVMALALIFWPWL